MLEFLVFGIYAITLYISFVFMLVLMEADTVTSEAEWKTDWPSLSLIIPAYNEEDTIAMTIESVLEAEYPEDKKEIIVVNDGSEDKTSQIAAKYEEQDKIKLINQKNQGKGSALNTGIEEASGKLIGCVDADSRLTNDSLKNIVSEMDEDSAGIASAMKVHDPQNTLEKLQMVEYVVGVLMRKILGIMKSIYVTPGPMSIYRRKKLEEVGGFDEESRVEDQEICYRFQERHEKLQSSRKGEVYTKAPSTLKEFYYQRKRWYLGSLENIIQYRNMFLNSDYGDFGMFVMPATLLQALLAIFGLGLIVYTTLKPFFNFFKDFSKIGFEAISIPVQFSISEFQQLIYWSLISQDFVFLTLISALATFSISIVYLAAIHTEESIRDMGIFAAIIYVFWFFLIIGFIWLVSIIEIMKGGDIGWSG